MGEGRRGRVQRIAVDRTPLGSPSPDVEARIGWLLAMSRLHHPDPAHAEGSRFLGALAEAGLTASRSAVSRWESGDVAASIETISAYEVALRLPPGQIATVAAYLRATITGAAGAEGSGPGRTRPRLDPASPAFAARLDELVDLAADGGADALRWRDLAWHLGSVPLVHLQAGTWERLAHRLVEVIPRSVRLAYRHYNGAVTELARRPRAQDPMVEAVAGYLDDPDVQLVTSSMGLLDRLPTARAARLVLDLVEDASTPTVFSHAVWLAAAKVRRGDLAEADRDRLGMIVLRLWRADPARAAQSLAELVAVMPEGLRSALTMSESRAGRAHLDHVVNHAETPEAGAAATSRAVAERARARAPQEPRYAEDMLLARLVREALAHRDSERRHQASLVLAASPFADGVATELLSLVAEPGRGAVLRQRAAVAARYLAGDRHRGLLVRLGGDPDPAVAEPLRQALGHLPLSEVTDQVLRRSLQPEWSVAGRATMYALGMTGSPGLTVLTRASGAPPWQQAAARWWLRHGRAVVD